MEKGHHGISDQSWIDAKRAKRMDMIDSYPPEIRELIHAYGLNTVKAFLDQGVTKAKAIRHLVETVLDEFSPTRGSFSSQGQRGELIVPKKPLDHGQTGR